MVKCAHQASITQFCIKNDCHCQIAGGCSVCFSQNHKHSSLPEKISLNELEILIKKYSFQKRIKPHCLNLQQTFYSFFKEIKIGLNQIISKVDNLCKNIVNNIGFPYLSEQGDFKIYKKIKNRDFMRISPKQMSQFVKKSQQVNEVSLISEEGRLYEIECEKYYSLAQKIDCNMQLFEKLVDFQSQKSIIESKTKNLTKLEQIIEKIQNQKGVKIIKLQEKNTKYIEISNQINNKPLKRQRTSYKYQNLRPEPFNLNFKKDNKATKQIESKNRSILKTEPSKQINFTNPLQKYQEGTRNKVEKALKNQSKDETNSKKSVSQKKEKKKSYIRRISSIDTQIEPKQNLEKKLKEKKRNWEKCQSQETEESKEIKNYDIRHLKSSDQGLFGTEYELEFENLTKNRLEYVIQEENSEECSSPVVQKKILAEKSKRKNPSLKQSSKNSTPYIIDTPLLTLHHGKLIGCQQEQISPEFTLEEEISSSLFLKSISLNKQEAIISLQKTLQACENNLSAAEYLSFLYFKAGQFQKCINLCQKYLKKLPIQNNDKKVRELLLINQSEALNALGRYSETVKLIRKQKSENKVLQRNLSDAFFCLGKYHQAIQLYQKLLKDCNDDEISYNLSVCWYMKEQFAKAKSALNPALRAQPSKPQYQELHQQICQLLQSNRNKSRQK